ncbi:L-threonine dehydratase catabolic TdcB [Planctomycetes bacterium Poly30]|uniref:L-threonine dehydratase catabolic TdcB n=1 Tax=Saltatorellus ferox TaxID=2528018 RepID=A0A518ES79_9BACT|nr:L-threonine dehydratase catabolic TdcB [Planctomycetes bacterium Poly30]
MKATVSDVARTAQSALVTIRPLLPITPVREALALAPDGSLFLKMESFQPTGSFKVRGAVNRIAALSEEERAAGVVAASTGNHGAAVAFAARAAGVRASVVVPVDTPAGRAEAIESRGAEVIRFGAECGEAEAHGRALAERTGRVFLSPYNDALVMAGQGTIGLELAEQIPDLRRVYVAVGGGGLIGGIGCALKDVKPGVEVIGCSPEASYPMHASVAAGRWVDTPHLSTLSLATAGGLEEDTVTLNPCMDSVDRWELVGEADISRATYELITRERMMVEGAVGVALAVWQRERAAGVAAEGSSCIVVCGGNLDAQHLRTILAENVEVKP